MYTTSSSSRWKQWIKPNRLIPLLTILGAGTALVLSLLGVIVLSISENIIIALLALLAVDALTERLSVLERIETKIANLSQGKILRSRAEIPPLEEQAGTASEICIVAISGISLSLRYFAFLEKKIRSGCKVRIVLLNPDPNGVGLQAWDLQSRITTTGTDITSTLEIFKQLEQIKSRKGKIEIRLLEIFLPFSMVAVDLQKESGSMVVEYHAFKTTISERPHVYLTPLDDPKWFNFYKQQFEEAWTNATVWSSKNAS